MLLKERHAKYPFIFLAMSLLAFVVLGLDGLLGSPANRFILGWDFELGLSTQIRGALQALIFIGSLIFVRDYLERKEVFSVIILLRRALIVGLLTLFVYYLLDGLPQIIDALKKESMGASKKVVSVNPVLNYVVDLFKPLVIVFYLLFTLVLFKKLIFFKKTKWDIIWWNVLQITLFVSLIFCFDWNIPTFISVIFQIIGGGLVLMLCVRLKWIGFLTTRDKLNSILFLVLINLMTFLLLQNFFIESRDSVLQTDFDRNIFMLLIGFTVLLYTVFSALALLFNLPTSTVSQQRSSELKSFQELTRSQGNINTEELFEKLFNIALETTQVDAAFILIDDPKEKYRFYATHNLKGEQVKLLKGYCRMEGSNMEKRLLFLNAVDETDRFLAIRKNYESLYYQPIMLKDRKIGDLFLLKTFANGFDEYMIRLVRSFMNQLMMTLHNVELLDETLEATRLKEEMAIARAVQQKLLPKELPNNDHFEVGAYYLSAHEVGGDYYDYAEVDGQHKVIIADVSGKGTNAAFHVAEMKGVFQALMHLKLSGKEFLNIANQSISKCFDKGIFITLSYLSIDPIKKMFTHSRAGHTPTIYYNAKEDKITLLEEKGLAFGILRNESYANHIEISQHQYNSGDILFFYTDGILEAREKNGPEEFGLDRIKKLIQKHKNLNTKDILDEIIQVLSVFTEGDMSFDDTTLVVVKFK